jgi:hypothetical protein
MNKTRKKVQEFKKEDHQEKDDYHQEGTNKTR